MKSKGIQYWILLLVSCIVFVLYVAEMYASHCIVKERIVLQEQTQTANNGPYYKDLWQKLAVDFWKGSAQDPALVDLLKSEGIGVHQGPPPGSAPPATNNAPPAAAPATNSPAAAH